MSSTEITAQAVTEHLETTALPSLYADKSFWGMTVTQFLGAFNDNLFKQLVLFLSIVTISTSAIKIDAPLAEVPAVGVEATDNQAQNSPQAKASDRQGTADIIFALPFLLVTGYAGYLADRYSKRTIIISCKIAEIFIMAAGAAAFSLYVPGQLGFLYIVLFMMGVHSGFFGPAKYGILPEMLRPKDLSRANGLILMTTFVAIILGGVVAGVLKEHFATRLWLASVVCMSLAVLGTISAFWVRPARPANPGMKFEWSALTVPSDMIAVLKTNRPLLMALFVSSVFWMLAGMVKSAITAVGLLDQHVGEVWTSYLFGIVSVGIALGAVTGGLISGDKIDFRVMRAGAIGMFVSMVLLAIPADGNPAAYLGPDGKPLHMPGFAESHQWLGYYGSLATLLLLGASTGLFIVPLQAFMQEAAPDGKKGRMIAVMNQANWVGIAINGVIYGWIAKLVEARDWPRCTAFFFVAAMMLPIVLFYRPKNEVFGEQQD
jgi:MFS family permease